VFDFQTFADSQHRQHIVKEDDNIVAVGE